MRAKLVAKLVNDKTLSQLATGTAAATNTTTTAKYEYDDYTSTTTTSCTPLGLLGPYKNEGGRYLGEY